MNITPDYHTEYQKNWEQRCLIKNGSRLIIDFTDSDNFFPLMKQPYLEDFRINFLSKAEVDDILLLSFFKHLLDITGLEINLINKACNSIIFDTLPIKFPEKTKLNTYTIIIDEYYHAYQAQDIILQIKEQFPVVNTFKFGESDASKAFNDVINELPNDYHEIFLLICVCVFETTLVGELTELFNKPNVKNDVKRYIRGHISDEARHFKFFRDLLEYTWQNLSPKQKSTILPKLNLFLKKYFSINSWRDFNLHCLSLYTDDLKICEDVISDYYDNFTVTEEIPVVKKLLNNLRSIGLVDVKIES